MLILKSDINYGGEILKEGSSVSGLPLDFIRQLEEKGWVEKNEPPVSLPDMTRAELETLAAKREIDISGAKKKGDIIKAIEREDHE